MGALLGVYHLFLEREKMHRFNRYYLLLSIVFSLVLPLIIIPIYRETTEAIPEAIESMPVIDNVIAPVAKPVNSMPAILWTIYGLFTAVFVIRFMSNLLHFKRKVSSGKVVRYKGAKLVLVTEKTLPHTFLNHIFINEQDYEAENIENELFTHELTHVRQKHTLDILFIEMLKTFLWFNPFLYLYGRSIRLNHEFLADENVVDETQNIISYQNILLQKTSTLTPAFASNLNFSLTKKRLLMMTKTTTRTKATLLQLAVAPILIVLLMLLCTEEVVAQQKNNSKKLSPEDYPGMYIESITQFQIDSLKKADPVKYADVNREYFHVKKRSRDKDGNIIVEKSFQKIADLYSKDYKEDANRATKYDNYTPPVKLEQNRTIAQDTVYNSGELAKMPEYTDGGIRGFYTHVNSNFVVPEIKEDITAKIYVAFVIEKDGSMSNIKIVKDPGHGLGDEALRVLKTIDKKWIPGETADGKVVRASYNLPITIHIRH